MQFRKLLLLGASLTLVSAKVHKAEAAQIHKIEAALNNTLLQGLKLFAQVNAFDGNPSTGDLDALKIQAQAYHVEKSIEKATSIVKATPKFTDSESLEVATAVLGLIKPVKLLLTTIVHKKPAFKKVKVGLFDATKQVKTVLVDTKALSLALGRAVVEKLKGGIKDAAPAILEDLENAFDNAIAAYSID